MYGTDTVDRIGFVVLVAPYLLTLMVKKIIFNQKELRSVVTLYDYINGNGYSLIHMMNENQAANKQVEGMEVDEETVTVTSSGRTVHKPQNNDFVEMSDNDEESNDSDNDDNELGGPISYSNLEYNDYQAFSMFVPPAQPAPKESVGFPLNDKLEQFFSFRVQHCWKSMTSTSTF
jgi:hypothetical protein